MDCEITTDIDHERLKSGDQVNATILLLLERPEQFRSLTATFLGAEKARVVIADSGRDGDSNETVRRTDVLIKEAYLLAGEEPRGFFSEWIDSFLALFGKGAATELASGEHRYSVALTIPENTLPTHKARNSEVFYRLTIRVDQPLKMDSVFDVDFIVQAPASGTSQSVTAYYPDHDTGTLTRTLSRDIRVTATIERDFYRVGDTVRGTLVVETDEAVRTKGITVCLLGEERVEIRRHRELYKTRQSKFEVVAATELQNGWRGDFDFPVEDLNFPTSTGKYFSLAWFVEIRIDLPWAKDCTIRMPVTLG